MQLGFYGSSRGLTPEQINKINQILKRLKPEVIHKYNQYGAQYDFHQLIQPLKTEIIVYSSNNLINDCTSGISKVINCNDLDAEFIKNSDLIMVALDTQKETYNSDSWCFSKKCNECKKPVILVYPK